MKVQKSYESFSDANLIEAYKQKYDVMLIGELFKRNTSYVLGISMTIFKDIAMSEDALMDIFTFLLEKLKTTKVTHVKSWLYMVTKNHCLQQLRKESKLRTDTIQEESVATFMELEHNQHHIEKQEGQNTRLLNCLEKLKKEQKICVERFFYENLSYEEITHDTGFTLSKVKSYIQNGKRNLKNCIEQQHD